MVGQTISHYRVLELLGSGGMGVVYKAQDLTLERTVALKFLPNEWAGDRLATERFLREARTAASLNHPNICTVHEVGEHDGAPFIAMELLEGQTLDRLIGGKSIEPAAFLDLAIQITEALEAAHSKGILHRDIKPSNIFVTPGRRAKVLDFGLAKFAQPDLSPDAVTRGRTTDILTVAGGAMGTVLYMSPEQARGEDLDARSDIFACGVTLYEMATGRQTFGGGTTAVVFDAILNREPPPISSLNAAVNPELERVIERAIEKDRELRYQSAADLRADLQRIKRNRESGRTRTSGMVPAVPLQAPASTHAIPSAGVPVMTVAPASGRRVSWGTVLGAIGTLFLAISLVFFFRSNSGSSAEAGPSFTSSEAALEPSVVPAATLTEPPVAAEPVAAGRAVTTPSPAAANPASTTTTGPRAGEPKPPPASPGVAPGLSEARKNFDDRLYDLALGDLKTILAATPSGPTATAATLLMARTYERLGRTDEAFSTCQTLRTAVRTGADAAECSFMMANLTLNSKRPDREASALELFGEVPVMAPKSAVAPQALAAKAVLEDRRKLRVLDPQLNTSVPASLVSYRSLVASYPDSPTAEEALWRLSELYDDLKRYALAAESLETLATRFPSNSHDAWWRAGDTWEKRAKDAARARAAYANVPTNSKKYKDAQQRLRP